MISLSVFGAVRRLFFSGARLSLNWPSDPDPSIVISPVSALLRVYLSFPTLSSQRSGYLWLLSQFPLQAYGRKTEECASSAEGINSFKLYSELFSGCFGRFDGYV